MSAPTFGQDKYRQNCLSLHCPWCGSTLVWDSYGPDTKVGGPFYSFLHCRDCKIQLEISQLPGEKIQVTKRSVKVKPRNYETRLKVSVVTKATSREEAVKAAVKVVNGVRGVSLVMVVDTSDDAEVNEGIAI